MLFVNLSSVEANSQKSLAQSHIVLKLNEEHHGDKRGHSED